MEAENNTPRKPNPRANANLFSKLFFCILIYSVRIRTTIANHMAFTVFSYMLPIFHRNYTAGCKAEDLFEALKSHKAKLLGDKLEEAWQQQNRRHKKWGLHRALFKIFGFELAMLGVLRLVHSLLAVSLMPLSLSYLLLYFDSKSDTTKTEAYTYAALIVLAIVLDVFIHNHVAIAMMHLCMKLRVSCCSLIYRKSMKLSQSAFTQTTTGQIINLLSNDVSKFDQGFYMCHYVWIAPIQYVVGTYLMYRFIGVTTFSGIGFLLLFLPLQSCFSFFWQKTVALRLRTAVRTDERVSLMNEFLGGIQVIKMYSWEKPFAKLISLARRLEMKAVRASLFLGATQFSLELILSQIAVFITIMVFISLGNGITANVIYPTIAVYDIFRNTITFLFSCSITVISEVHVSVTRIQTFLNLDEFAQLSINSDITDGSTLPIQDKNNKSLDMLKAPTITLTNVSAKWLPDSSGKTLTDINMSVEHSELTAITGKVGSGKSSLLNVILKELPVSEGSLNINGTISYASQEAWLFSASIRQNILFGESYIEDRYKDVVKMCALEQDFAVLPHGDKTIVGEKGKKLSGGQKARVNLARCIYKNADIYLLDDPLSAVDTKVGQHLYEDCITKFLSGKIRILVTHQLQYLRNASEIIILEEGRIVGKGSYKELEFSGLNFAKLLREFSTTTKQKASKTSTEYQTDAKPLENCNPDDNTPEDTSETIKSGHITASVYCAYFKAGGKFLMIGLLILATASLQGVGNVADYYISQWVNMEQAINNTYDEDVIDRSKTGYSYSLIILALIACSLCQLIFFFMFSTRASIHLHEVIFSKVSCATMKFFNANPGGRVLNRFSMDMGVIDEALPYLVFNVLQIFLLFLGTAALTSIINPWLLIPAIGLSLFYFLLRNIYIETSRSIKRVEGVARSPIITHMTASIRGLPTIRALLSQPILITEFDNILDVHSSAWFIYISSNKAFSFWLDLISAFIISIVTLSLVFLSQNYVGGEAGLILTQYLGLSRILQFGIRSICDLENDMVSAERVLEYTTIETEPVRKHTSTLPKSWPEFGRIVFEKVSMGYSTNNSSVLKCLNFTINPLEKIGIVGRTGAGKSSIVAALFNLYDIEGTILIDGVDTKTVPLEGLRPKISIIPQDPVLFSATVRKNLDPFDEYDEELIWKVLEHVELKQVVEETPSGLNTKITEGGSNFSIGQRQLICLARAMLRNNKILVMDEATGNVDPYTDSVIQKTIRKNFDSCTVITIAHRLHTIIDYDRVLVMDAGQVVEFDRPYNLLQRKDGMFYNMIQTLGYSAMTNL